MSAMSYDYVRTRFAPISWRLTAIAMFTLVVAVFAATIKVVPYGRAVWDFIGILDGAYRIGLGQVPHVDFSSNIGPLSLYTTYWAERLFPNGQPFIGMHAMVWFIAVPPFAVLATRIPSGWGFAASFAILAVTILAPYTLDPTMLSEISYFATYNRFATALLFLAGIWFVLPKGRGDGLLLGYILIVLALFKITAAFAMLGLVGGAVLLGRAQLTTALVMLVTMVVAAAIIQFHSGLVSGYIHEIITLIELNSGLNKGGSIYRLAQLTSRNWIPLGVTLTIVIFAIREQNFGAALRRPIEGLHQMAVRQRFVVDTALVVLVALVAESQNTGGVGLIAAAAMLLHPNLWAQRGWRVTAAAVLGAALVFPLADTIEKRVVSTVVREQQGTTEHAFSKLFPGMRLPAQTLAGSDFFTRLRLEWLPYLSEIYARGFDLDGDPSSTSPAYRAALATSVVEAADQFQKRGYAAKANHYATINFVDPFPRLLGLESARGTTLYMDSPRTLPVFSNAQAADYLALADGVFFEKCGLRGAADTNQATFRAVLDRGFVRYSLHPCWDFYSRNR